MNLFGFNVNKFKPALKMSIHRISIIKNKKINQLKTDKRIVANLLAEGKEEKARIKVEGIIRDDFTLEAYEILELLCDLLGQRTALMNSEKDCPYDMREGVCTIIWAASRTEIPEMEIVKKQLGKKYGADFVQKALQNADGCVNERVIHKLSVQPPSAYLVLNYMKEIAKEHNVDWKPDETKVIDPLAPMAAPTGASIPLAPVSGLDHKKLYVPICPDLGKPPSALLHLPSKAPETVSNSPPAPPSSSSVDDTPALPAPTNSLTIIDGQPTNSSCLDGPATNPSTVPDFDELSARFEKLRQKQ